MFIDFTLILTVFENVYLEKYARVQRLYNLHIIYVYIKLINL